MGNLGLLMKLYNWWKRFIGILKGEVAPSKVPVDAWTLQLRLLTLGYAVHLTGELDERTRTHLRKFQANNGLEPDGLFGPATQKALGL